MNKKFLLGAAMILWIAGINGVATADVVSIVGEARSARIGGNPERSLVLIDEWLMEHPGDGDALVEKGYAQITLGDFAGARVSFETVLKLSQDYEDAKLGLARLDYFGGDYASAMDRLAGLKETEETRTLLSQVQAARTVRSDRPIRAVVFAEQSHLGNALPDWSALALSLSSRVSDETAVTGTVEHTRRFGREDMFAQIQMDRRLKAGRSVYVGIGGTVNADFRPRATIFAGGEFEISAPQAGRAGLDATLIFSGAEYNSGPVYTLSPGLSARLFGDRLNVRGRVIALSDEMSELRYGYAQDVRLQISERFGFGLGWSDAPETSEGRTLDVESISLSGDWKPSMRTKATLSLVSEERSAYERQSFAVSISRAVR